MVVKENAIKLRTTQKEMTQDIDERTPDFTKALHILFIKSLYSNLPGKEKIDKKHPSLTEKDGWMAGWMVD